jgi:hypothetical protein
MTFGAAPLPKAGTGSQVPREPLKEGQVRLFIVGAALHFLTTTVAAGQSRWTISAGPEWTPTFGSGHFYGGRLRAEYDLIKPTSPFRLRFETGTFWSPTQSFFGSYIDGSSVYGFKQSMDLTVGLSAAISPLPRARFSPYVMMGVQARQTWSHGANSFTNPDGSLAWNEPERSRTYGDVLWQAGIGMRARIGGRMFQLEMRHFSRQSLTLGTNLPF